MEVSTVLPVEGQPWETALQSVNYRPGVYSYIDGYLVVTHLLAFSSFYSQFASIFQCSHVGSI